MRLDLNETGREIISYNFVWFILRVGKQLIEPNISETEYALFYF